VEEDSKKQQLEQMCKKPCFTEYLLYTFWLYRLPIF